MIDEYLWRRKEFVEQGATLTQAAYELLYVELPKSLLEDSLLAGVHLVGLVEKAADIEQAWNRLRGVLGKVLRQKAGLTQTGKVLVVESKIINGEQDMLRIASELRDRGVVDARLMDEIPWGGQATLDDGKSLAGNIDGKFSDAEHAYDLGADPGSRWRSTEAVQGLHLELQEGLQLRRCSDPAYDWVTSGGTTYDAVGGFQSQFFDLTGFTNQIRGHLDRQGLQIVVVDIATFTPAQIEQIENYVMGLTQAEIARIVFLLRG